MPLWLILALVVAALVGVLYWAKNSKKAPAALTVVADTAETDARVAEKVIGADIKSATTPKT